MKRNRPARGPGGVGTAYSIEQAGLYISRALLSTPILAAGPHIEDRDMYPRSGPSRCPRCGWRRHSRPRVIRPAPLLDWIARQKAMALARASAPAGARLMLRHDLREAAGEPPTCLALPGLVPLAFPSLSAALAALADMEAGHGGR